MPHRKQSNIGRNMCLGAVPLPLMKTSNITRNASIGAAPYAPNETIQHKKKHVFDQNSSHPWTNRAYPGLMGRC